MTRLFSDTLLIAAAVQALLLGPADLRAGIITFDSLMNNGNNYVGSTYSEGGYNVSASGPNGLWSINPGAANGRYTGSTSVFSATVGGVITLQRADGKPFNLDAITLAELNPNLAGAVVNFTGTRYYGGSAVAQAAPLSGGPIDRQTTTFSNFELLSSVSWQQLSPYHQFDDIVLDAASLAPPTTVYANSQYRVNNGFNGDLTGDVLQNGTALVGNLNSLNAAAAPDYRGFAKFVLDRTELIAATTALLSLTPVLGNLPPNPTEHMDIVLEAILSPFGQPNQTSDFQATPIGGTVFNTSTLTLNQPTTFDVTSYYNLAIQSDQNLTFRLRQLSETSDYRPLNWGFSDFQLALDYSVPEPEVTGVPEPASIALLALTAIGGVGLRWRQRRKSQVMQVSA